nr:hypothetical protein Iba_chr12dCG8810 [Ipomoea batatas]
MKAKSTRVEPTKLERKEIHERRIRFDLIPPAKQISSTAGNLISKDKIPVLTGSCQSYLILSVWEVTAWVSRFLEGHAEPFLKIYEQHMESIMVQEEDYPEFQRYIFAQNKVIPKEIWPREGIQPDVRQDDEIYHERIKSARNQYYYELSQANKGEDIWSQDPWNFDDIDSGSGWFSKYNTAVYNQYNTCGRQSVDGLLDIKTGILSLEIRFPAVDEIALLEG